MLPLRFGLAVRLVSRGNSVRIRFGSPFSSNIVIYGQSCDFVTHKLMKILKWLSLLPISMQESFWW